MKTPIHTPSFPNVDSCHLRKLKYVRGEEINFFKAGDAFIENNNGGLHYVKNVGKKQSILHVGVISVVGMPTAINKQDFSQSCSNCMRIELLRRTAVVRYASVVKILAWL